MRLAILLLAAGIQLAAQTYTLGTAADPCVGGSPLTIFQTANTVRWGDFACSFSVADDLAYTVQTSYLEPCFAAGACAAGQANVPSGQRLESVFANDQLIVGSFDPLAAGATDTKPAVRRAIVYPVAGKIVLRVVTVRRSGILSAVSITPATATAPAALPLVDSFPIVCTVAPVSPPSVVPTSPAVPAAPAITNCTNGVPQTVFTTTKPATAMLLVFRAIVQAQGTNGDYTAASNPDGTITVTFNEPADTGNVMLFYAGK